MLPKQLCCHEEDSKQFTLNSKQTMSFEFVVYYICNWKLCVHVCGYGEHVYIHTSVSPILLILSLRSIPFPPLLMELPGRLPSIEPGRDPAIRDTGLCEVLLCRPESKPSAPSCGWSSVPRLPCSALPSRVRPGGTRLQ